MKTIALVAGGPKENLPVLIDYHHDDVIWVGIDRGALYIQESGLPLNYAFGDFDSITNEERNELTRAFTNLSIFSAEKDKTDTELALEWAVQQSHEFIQIFGATGGRIDHMLGNIQLLSKTINYNTKIEIIDRQNHITLFTPGTYTIKKRKEWKYISFIPISHEVKGITLEGFKYPLKNCHISIGSTLCISNELIHELGTFSFHDGIILMIRSRD
ncbi:thiamine diphosphokinase [Metabacillus bambusae]|uniref:Thiamine diphosphokinase n=1 Tax=Metabacillus bambusae TaxID=2795218 RepID=A0ABS3MX67_9BACI|nr:thiamine diphosphokinase [Metabacillus bambusae]MBO1510454.1 thiamine diphosphokinase [Metabacillus bambusae]